VVELQAGGRLLSSHTYAEEERLFVLYTCPHFAPVSVKLGMMVVDLRGVVSQTWERR
jgi:hypothetical protein